MGEGIYFICSILPVGRVAFFLKDFLPRGWTIVIILFTGLVLCCIYQLIANTITNYKKNRLKELEQESHTINWGKEETNEDDEVEMPLLNACHV